MLEAVVGIVDKAGIALFWRLSQGVSAQLKRGGMRATTGRIPFLVVA